MVPSCTFWYFLVLVGTLWYFVVLIGTLWYFLVLVGNCWYFLQDCIAEIWPWKHAESYGVGRGASQDNTCPMSISLVEDAPERKLTKM